MSDDRPDFDILNPPGADTDIPSVPALKPADTLISNKINAIPLDPGMMPDNEVPGLLQEMRRVMGRLHPDDWRSQEGAVKQLRAEYNAAYMDRQRAQHLATEQKKQVEKEEENKILVNAGTKGVIPTSEELYANERLGDRRLPLVNHFLHTLTKGQVDERTSAVNTAAIIGNITAGNIRDPQEITKAYTEDHSINYNDWVRSLAALKDRHDPAMAAWQNSFKDLKKALEPKIYGPHILADLDEDQRLRMYRFDQDVRDLVNKAITSSPPKDPSVYFRYDSPEFVGRPEFTKKYEPSMAETISKKTAAENESKGTTSNIGSVAKAVEAGTINRDQARAQVEARLGQGGITPSEIQEAIALLTRLGYKRATPSIPGISAPAGP